MKENFVIREERHPGARSVAKFCEGTAGILGLVFFGGGILGVIFSDLGDIVFPIVGLCMFWCPVLGLTAWLINVTVKDTFIGGFDVAGLRVKATVSSNNDGEMLNITEFIVNGEYYSIEKKQYGIAELENGHKIEMYVEGQDGDITDTYIELDGEIIVENGQVYVDKIGEIMTGSSPSTNPQELPVDIGGVPPYHAANDVDKTVAPRNKHYAVIAETGTLANRRFDIASELVFGRDARECSVVFPADTAGVSRVHCKLVVEGNELCLYDLGSTYGTIVNNKMKLTANQMMHIKDGDKITIGDNQTFVVSIN